MPTTARTRRVPSACAFKAIAAIGASIGARIPVLREQPLCSEGGGVRQVMGVCGQAHTNLRDDLDFRTRFARHGNRNGI
jgi:hypothetical protein